MSKILLKAIFAACILSTSLLQAETRIVNTTSDDPNTVGTLAYWLLNANSGDTIDCSQIAGQSITLTSSLPAITNSYTINGAGITINGAGSYQAFQVASGNVTINNVTVLNAVSKGGNGGEGYSGGGGGVGGGGALYIHGDTTVTLTASSLVNNTAQGGKGGSASNIGNAGAGGGGGYGGGNGGNCLTAVSSGGGGGGHSNGGDGGSNTSVDGSNGVYYGGGGGGAGINSVAPGGAGGNASPNGTFLGGAESTGNGGGGAGDSQNGFAATGSGGAGVPGNGGNGIGADSLFGGGGGGGAASETGFSGGTGVGAAGGGGGSNYAGGSGGILGGGGGGGLGGTGGDGGFGAGGGGAVTGGMGGGGYGATGGNGGSDPNNNGGGGGGSGLGGAIFVQSGGHLIIADPAEISGNTVVAGIGGSSTSSSDPNYIPPGDGAAMGYDIFVREQGLITFDLSNTLNIATAIEGDQTNGPNTTGGLEKMGKGTLKLNGSNTYSGLTHVFEGTLNLNGSVIGSAIVDAGGKLSGNATISGDLTNSGILSPGNSIGTILTTNLMLTPSSLVEIEVAADGANDIIAATESAQLDGILEIIPLPGSFQAVQSYTIITAGGGRTGVFSAVESSEPSLIAVNYQQDAVVVEVLPINSIGLDPNAEAAASCYLANGFITGSDIEAVSAALLTLDAAGINDGFNQIQPSRFSGLAWSQIQNALLVRSSYSRHLEKLTLSCGCCDGTNVWGEVIGAWQKQNTSRHEFGFTDNTGGITVGLDVCANELRVGVAGSYTYSRLNWDKSAGHANINSYYGGIYTNWTNGLGYVNTAVLGAFSRCQTNRHLHFATIDRHATSRHNSWEVLTGLEAGYKYGCFECVETIPFVRVDLVYLARQRFAESGADSLNLIVNRSINQIIQSELGIIWTGHYVYENLCLPGSLVPRIKLSYINDTPFGARHLHASFVDSDCSFSVTGLSFNRNLGAVSIGLTYLNCDETIGVTLRYDGQYGSKYFNQAANVALDMQY